MPLEDVLSLEEGVLIQSQRVQLNCIPIMPGQRHFWAWLAALSCSNISKPENVLVKPVIVFFFPLQLFLRHQSLFTLRRAVEDAPKSFCQFISWLGLCELEWVGAQQCICQDMMETQHIGKSSHSLKFLPFFMLEFLPCYSFLLPLASISLHPSHLPPAEPLSGLSIPISLAWEELLGVRVEGRWMESGTGLLLTRN